MSAVSARPIDMWRPDDLLSNIELDPKNCFHMSFSTSRSWCILFSSENEKHLDFIRKIAKKCDGERFSTGTYHPKGLERYKISDREFRDLFEIYLEAQKEHSLYIPSHLFHLVLKHLMNLTGEETLNYYKSINHRVTSLEDYIESATKNENALQAMSIAHYISQNENRQEREKISSMTLKWICLSANWIKYHINFDPEHRFVSEWIDLRPIFRAIHGINRVDFFEHRELRKAAKNIDWICLRPVPEGISPEIAARIGKFLGDVQTISILNIDQENDGKEVENQMTARVFRPITEGIRRNPNLERIYLRNISLENKGICELIQAIETNSKSKVKFINLIDCRMTDKSVPPLLKLMKQRSIIVDVSKNILSADLNKKIEKQNQENENYWEDLISKEIREEKKEK